VRALDGVLAALDEHGDATIPVELADSLTTWRIRLLASSLDGGIGEKTESLIFERFDDFGETLTAAEYRQYDAANPFQSDWQLYNEDGTFTIRPVTPPGTTYQVTSTADSGPALEFELVCPLGRRQVPLALAGEHNVMNALAAAAAAHAAGANLDAIVDGLADMRAVAGRLEFKALEAGGRLIDDSYNANPASVRAGLRALVALPGEHWLVLGEMRELGEESARLHADIGEFARECGVKRLFAVGDEARHAVETFGAGATWFAVVEHLIESLRGEVRSGVTVLVKGSRSNRLERVAIALAEPRQLLCRADRHPELRDDDAVLRKLPLELVDFIVGALPVGPLRESPDPLHQHTPVPGAIENRVVTARRQL